MYHTILPPADLPISNTVTTASGRSLLIVDAQNEPATPAPITATFGPMFCTSPIKKWLSSTPLHFICGLLPRLQSSSAGKSDGRGCAAPMRHERLPCASPALTRLNYDKVTLTCT